MSTPTMDVSTVPPSQEVVKRVAAREGVDHTELVPLFDVIDPDALDRIVQSGRPTESSVHLTFTYHGYEVMINGDGVVQLAKEDAKNW